MKHFKDLFKTLLEQGLVYRYTQKRFAELSGGGQPFPSPIQEVETLQGKIIEELIQPIFSPIVLKPEEKVQVEKIAQAWPVFVEAQQKLFEMARKGELNSFVKELIFATATPTEKEKGLLFPGYSGMPFIRLDAIRTSQGFKVIDINTTRPAGVGDCIVVSQVFSDYFRKRPYPLSEVFTAAVKQCLFQWSESFSKRVNKLFFVQPSYDGDWHNFRVLKEALQESLDLETEIIVASELDKVNWDGLLRGRIKENHPTFSLLAQNYPERFIISPLWKRYLGSKLWMYLLNLRDLEDFWKESLKEHFQVLKESFIPTFLVRYGWISNYEGKNFSFYDLDRREWILKAPSGSSARGMVFGKMTGKKRWEETIKSSKGVVQKFEKVKEKLTVVSKMGELCEEEFYTKYGIFILGGRLAGLEVMARRNPVVHGARNTYFSCVFMD